MRYVYPFYREEHDDHQVSFLLPFLGGALLGGLFAPAFVNKNPGYYYPGYVNNYPPYPPYNPYQYTNYWL